MIEWWLKYFQTKSLKLGSHTQSTKICLSPPVSIGGGISIHDTKEAYFVFIGSEYDTLAVGSLLHMPTGEGYALISDG